MSLVESDRITWIEGEEREGPRQVIGVLDGNATSPVLLVPRKRGFNRSGHPVPAPPRASARFAETPRAPVRRLSPLPRSLWERAGEERAG